MALAENTSRKEARKETIGNEQRNVEQRDEREEEYAGDELIFRSDQEQQQSAGHDRRLTQAQAMIPDYIQVEQVPAGKIRPTQVHHKGHGQHHRVRRVTSQGEA